PLPRQAKPGDLERARQTLLGLLQRSLEGTPADVTVVFDGSGTCRGREQAERSGIRVQFSKGDQKADDLIEDMLREAAAPERITVVSADHRLQRAARRRHAKVLGCGDFLDRLPRLGWTGASAAQADRKPAASPDETAHWLERFGDLQQLPEFREFFDKFGLDKEK